MPCDVSSIWLCIWHRILVHQRNRNTSVFRCDSTLLQCKIHRLTENLQLYKMTCQVNGTFPTPWGTFPTPLGTFPTPWGTFPAPWGTFPAPGGPFQHHEAPSRPSHSPWAWPVHWLGQSVGLASPWAWPVRGPSHSMGLAIPLAWPVCGPGQSVAMAIP